ncbi:hypothetical protein D3C81_1612740 [compost metagenome]
MLAIVQPHRLKAIDKAAAHEVAGSADHRTRHRNLGQGLSHTKQVLQRFMLVAVRPVRHTLVDLGNGLYQHSPQQQLTHHRDKHAGQIGHVPAQRLPACLALFGRPRISLCQRHQ